MTSKSKHTQIQTLRVLVVGAGGIGCEVLKNLTAAGFEKVHVVDSNKIDDTNLNRQFLFRKEHVSSSKAEIATKVIKQFFPQIDLTFDHKSIFSQKYSAGSLKSYDIIINTLKSEFVKKHVSFLFQKARRPLIEILDAGYFGQIRVFNGGLAECSECVEETVTQKTFPGCTIRNTPSEHIHCTVWAKHVFNQLFGELDIDDDVSQDMKAEEERPEGAGPTQEEKEQEDKEPEPVGTRQWATSVDYDPARVFDKLFQLDIEYLTKMEHLWRQRKRPSPLSFTAATDNENGVVLSYDDALEQDTVVWSLATSANVFAECVKGLQEGIKADSDLRLSFDKDVPMMMSFVAACANIRASIYGIPTESMFHMRQVFPETQRYVELGKAITASRMTMEAIKCARGEHQRVALVNVRKMSLKFFVMMLKKRLQMTKLVIKNTGTNSVFYNHKDDNVGKLDRKLFEFAIRDNDILECLETDCSFEVSIIIRHSGMLNEEDVHVLCREHAAHRGEDLE